MTTDLTTHWARALVRLYVGACSRCGGDGLYDFRRELRIPEQDDFMFPECEHCNGHGAALADATRGNWPWWKYQDVERQTGGPPARQMRPYIPDLTRNDDAALAAAVRVAERVAERLNEHDIVIGTSPTGLGWEAIKVNAWVLDVQTSLPAAVRAALERWEESS